MARPASLPLCSNQFPHRITLFFPQTAPWSWTTRIGNDANAACFCPRFFWWGRAAAGGHLVGQRVCQVSLALAIGEAVGEEGGRGWPSAEPRRPDRHASFFPREGGGVAVGGGAGGTPTADDG